MDEYNPKKKNADSQVKEKSGDYSFIEERFEIINGIRYDFLSSPKFVHQKLLGNLHVAMNNACCLDGEIILAPLDVHLDENNIVQPDIIYIANENRHIIRDGFVFGAPDLVVEILSASTARKDKTVKKTAFEKFGVGEYWVFDPSYQTVDQFVLEGGRYDLIRTLVPNETLTSPRTPCLSIDLSRIFPAEPPDA
jgi:Uma2 family endonuclease